MNPSPREGSAEDHDVQSAGEFLDVLSPRNARWRGEPENWLFRGHANAEWHLKASAFRDPDPFLNFRIDRHEIEGESDYRTMAAYRVAHQFRLELEAAGLQVPVADPPLDERDAQRREDPWLSDQDVTLMALAQHHGLPTLLIDWSRRSFVAAYFAAVGASERIRNIRGDAGSHLSVVALGAPKLARTGRHQSVMGLRAYVAPAWTNPNMRAQVGVFTALHIERRPSIEEYFAAMTRNVLQGAQPPLIRFTLHASKGPALLRLLAQEGITGGSMFPGPDGVVRAMRERALWGV